MPPTGYPTMTASRGDGTRPDCEPPSRTVVWVGGEHDLATRMHLMVTIARAARLDDADVVVDLSGVTFLDASTIGALVGARNRLRASSSRSLSVRAPSPPARRLLDVCELAHLIDERPARVEPSVAPALGSWVDVPASDRGPDSAQPPVTDDARSEEPARATTRRPVEPAGSLRLPRAPS